MNRTGPQTREQAAYLLVREISRLYGVTVSDIFGPSRYRSNVAPRHEAMWSCRQLGFSWHQLGDMFERHHTTVIAAVQKHERRRAQAALRSREQPLTQTPTAQMQSEPAALPSAAILTTATDRRQISPCNG